MHRSNFRVVYPWPTADPDPKLQEALYIAMDYLELTGQASMYLETERACAAVIMALWEVGLRHRIGLANYAIEAIEELKPRPVETVKKFKEARAQEKEEPPQADGS
jgi:hypothetical protein